jgi:hypothetical protein
MTISATVPANQLDSANSTLESAGHGPNNFSVPIYTGPRPTHATLHAWTDAAFESDVAAIPNVIVSQIAGSPADRVAAAMPSNGQWGGNAPDLTGQVTPGLYTNGGELWWVIQAFDRAVFDQPLEAYPALVRRARTPGDVQQWVQPIDEFDAYLLSDPFNSAPERVLHTGTEWVTTRDINVWEPGTADSGWTDVNAPVVTVEPWAPGGGTGTAGSYNLGDQVTHDNPNDSSNIWLYESAIAANTTQPGRDATFDRWWTPLEVVL